MATLKVLSETPISMAEVREELSKIKKRDEELGVRAGKTEDYLNEFCKLDIKKARELYEKVEKLNIPRLRDQHIWKIIDLMPKNVEELKVILQAYTISVSNENVKKIADIVKEY